MEYFQILNIPTKILKAQINLVQSQLLIKKGAPITKLQSSLLLKLKMRPFIYEIKLVGLWSNGIIISPKEIFRMNRFIIGGLRNLQNISIETQVCNPLSVVSDLYFAIWNLKAILQITKREYGVDEETSKETKTEVVPVVVEEEGIIGDLFS